MATEIDELIVQIKADTKHLNAELKHVRGQLNKTFPKGQGGNSPVGRFAGALRGLLAPLAAVASGMAAIAAVRGIANVSMEFEDLKDSLDTVFGSMKAGDQAMQNVLSFAQTTPFQVEDVTKAFIALQSAGIEPTRDMLQTFADTASVSVDQLGVFEALVRVTQRSASGGLGLEELNMIMDRGIDVLGILKDRLNLTKDDIAKFGQTAEGARIIMAALTDGLNEKFGGAMENKMDNLSTKTSNMTIAFKSLLDEIGKGGLIDFLKDTADYFTTVANKITTIVRASRTGVSVEAQRLMQPEEGEVDQQAVAKQLLSDIRGAANDLAFNQVAMERMLKEGGDPTAFNAVAARIESTRQIIQGSLAALKDVSDEDFTTGIGAVSGGMRSGFQQKIDIEGPGAAATGIARSLMNEVESSLGPLLESTLHEGVPITLDIQFDKDGIPRFVEEVKKEVEKETGGQGEGGPSPEELLRAGQIQLMATDARKMLEKIADPLIPIKAMLEDIGELEILKDAEGNSVFSSDEIEALRGHLNGLITEASSADLEEKFGAFQSAVEDTVTPLERAKQQIADMQAILDSGDAEAMKFIFGTMDMAEIEVIMDKLRDGLKDLKTDTEETAATFAETMAPAIASLAHSFTNDFVAALTSGQNALSAFKDFAKSLVNQIIATFLQMAVVNQILNAIFGRFDGFQALPTISFGGGQAGESASGGAMMRGKPYLVGERGPEMFVPHTAGTLRNGNDTRSMMGGGRPIIVNQNLNFATGVVPTVRAEVQRMLPQISEVTKVSVLEATQRGGNYRRGLLGG